MPADDTKKDERTLSFERNLQRRVNGKVKHQDFAPDKLMTVKFRNKEADCEVFVLVLTQDAKDKRKI